jgi:hypothetical protein
MSELVERFTAFARKWRSVSASDHIYGIDDHKITAPDLDTAAARITQLEAEVARFREVAGRCATIVDRYLYRQHEKVEDVPKLLRAALGEQGVG